MNTKFRPFVFFPFFVLSACASKQDLVLFNDDLRKLKTDSEAIKIQSVGSSSEIQQLRDDLQKLKSGADAGNVQSATTASQIQQLRDDLQKLKSDSESNKTQSATSYADVQQIRDEVFRIQGSFEGSTHKNSEAFRRLGVEDSLLVYKADDIESRLQKVEQFIAGLGKSENQAAALPLKKGDAASVKAPERLNEKALFDDGMEKLGKQGYVAARECFSALLKSYPKSELADKAQFQLAESFFAEKKYENAILEYQVVIAKYLKSGKRPSALYKQALSFEKIGDPVNAKARYKDLLKVYPNSPEAGLAKKKR
ncbi:MAG: tol-pal system protein YbgF [Chlorobium sp.]